MLSDDFCERIQLTAFIFEAFQNICNGFCRITILVSAEFLQLSQQGRAINAIAPCNVSQDRSLRSVGPYSSGIAFEDLICVISMTALRIRDGNGMGCIVCEYCRAHRQQQSQRQHEGERAFYCFHGLVLPFAFRFFIFIQL